MSRLILRGLPVALLGSALAIALTSCQLLEDALPTIVPPAGREKATTAPMDESPRLRNSLDIPPTWTPPPSERSETPIAPAEAAPKDEAAPEDQAAPEPGSQGSYTVELGDTLAGIALKYNVSIEALALANDIEDYDHIEAGQVLVIPGF